MNSSLRRVLFVSAFVPTMVWNGCICDDVLGELPAPKAVLVAGDQEAPPLDHLTIGIAPTTIGGSAQVEFRVKNIGDADLVVGNVVLVNDPELCPSSSAAFRVVEPTGAPATMTVAEKDEAGVRVTFTPTSGQPSCAVVEVQSNDKANPTLHALITGQGDAPQLCTDRGVIDFGEVLVGDHKDDVVHITSCGTRPVEIAAITTNAQFPDPFTGTIATAPMSLAVGDAIDMPVTFTPLVVGSWSVGAGNAGSITLASADGAQYAISLVGTSREPPRCSIQVVPNVVQFGNVGAGRTSTQNVIVRNIGQLDCAFTSADIVEPAGSFSRVLTTLTAGDTLAPGQSGALDVTFAPTVVAGTENGILRVVSDDPVNPTIDVPLEGTSVEVSPCFLEAAPTAVNFGFHAIHHSLERSVTLTNVGVESCILRGVELTTGAPDFLVLEPAFPITPVPSGSAIDIVTTFRPETPGAKSGNARVTYKLFGFGEPDQTLDIPLTGQAQAPCITVTPLDVDYGTVAAGASADRNVTISNCGGVDLTIRGIALRSGSDPDFVVTASPPIPAVMPAGASSVVTVRAQPQDAGAMFGSLEVLSDVDPQVVSLRANAPNGCPDGLVCMPDDELVFGDVIVGETLTKSFICTNPGTQPITLNLTGLAAPYTVVSAPNAIAAGGQGVIRVQFAPTTEGQATDTLDFGANTCDGQPLTADVRGEGNNQDLPPCPTAQEFQPQLLWNWDGGTTHPASNQVWSTALVSRLEDTTGDAVVTREDTPRVVFLSFDRDDSHLLEGIALGSETQMNDPVPGLLRAIDGATGAEVWTAGEDNPEHRTNSGVTPALVDLDADGCVDIVAQKYVLLPGVEMIPNGPKIAGKFARGNLIAFDCHGAFKWVSDEWSRSPNELEDAGAIAVGDVDGDGFAEVAVGDHLFNHDGRLRFRGGRGTGSAGHGPVSVLADVDGQPGLELVAGSTVYRADGSILWDRLDDVDFDGLPAVADMDHDGDNEVVFRSSEVRIFDGPTGTQIAGPRYPPTRAGMQGEDCDFSWEDQTGEGASDACNIIPSPTAVMDIDNDGTLDIVVPAQELLDCYEMDLSSMWRGTIYDGTGASGPMGFDFEADGYQNVVFADENTLRGWNSTGGVVYEADRQSVTLYEYPSLADIDNDGHANFVIGSNDPFIGVSHGLKAYANSGVGWAQARGIWNQHAYLEQLVSELGTPIPNMGAHHYDSGFRTATPQCVP